MEAIDYLKEYKYVRGEREYPSVIDKEGGRRGRERERGREGRGRRGRTSRGIGREKGERRDIHTNNDNNIHNRGGKRKGGERERRDNKE